MPSLSALTQRMALVIALNDERASIDLAIRFAKKS